MLCVDCGAFFDSRSEKWRKKYLELKTEAVHRLKANAQTSELPQFRDFKLDLKKFRMALTRGRIRCSPVLGTKRIYHGFRRRLEKETK